MDKEKRGLSDEEIITCLLEGDKNGFRLLYERYKTRVYTLAYRMTGNHEDALDITQETFIKIFKGISHFRRGASLSTWIYSIAHNACCDALRHKKRKLIVTLNPETAPIQNPTTNWEAKEIVQNALLELPEDFRAALVLSDIFGFSYAEISEILSIPLGTVKSKIARGRKRLSEKLRNLREKNGV